MAIETLYAVSHVAGGTASTPGNAIGNTPTSWTTDTGNTSWASRWEMGDPVDPKTSGATNHTITVPIRKETGQSGTPSAVINLYSNGAFVREIASDSITSTTGQNLVGTFTSAEIGTLAQVSIEVSVSAAGGNPSSRSSAQISMIKGDFNTTVAVEDTTPPSIPQNLQATSVEEPVLTWNASTDDSGTVTGYEVERSTSSGSGFANVATVSGTTWTDTTAAGSQTYYYRVRAYDPSDNFSDYSDEATATTPTPVVPIDTRLVFSMPTPPANLVGIQEFRVYLRSSGPDSLAAELHLEENGISRGTLTTATIAGGGTEQQISAIWDSSLLTDPSGVDVEIAIYGTGVEGSTLEVAANGHDPGPEWETQYIDSEGPADEIAPSIPTNFTASATSNPLLEWTASTDNVGVKEYEIDRAEDGQPWEALAIVAHPTTSYTDITAPTETLIWYRIRAWDDAGNVSDYASTSATTPAVEPPPAVSLVQQTIAGETNVRETELTVTPTFKNTPATRGNLLVSAISWNKNAGTITLPPGWTLIHDQSATSVSGALAFKIAAGGEWSATWKWQVADMHIAWIAEYNLPNGGLDVAAVETSTGEGTTSSLALGPTDNTVSPALALATVATDTISTTGWPPSWTNSFTSVGNVDIPGLSGRQGFDVAHNTTLTPGNTISTTASWTNADQAWGALAVFRAEAVPTPDPVDPTTQVAHQWVGAPTPTGFTAAATLTDATYARLVVSTQSDLSSPVYTEITTPDSYGRVKATVIGLSLDTDYYYGWEVDGFLANKDGHARTLGAKSFSFCFASCAVIDSNNTVFDTIVNRSPAYMLHLGDLHYANINTNDPDLFREYYARQLDQPRQASMFSKVPTLYTWDDHDYGPNGSWGGSASGPAANSAYRQYVPHPPLVESTTGIYQSFRAGKFLVIMLDVRSFRSQETDTDDASKTMLGSNQKAWLKQLLLDNPTRPKFICVGVPWIASADGGDHWGSYQTERTELVNFISANSVENIILLAGDMHAVASDDGRNSPGGLPIFHAAALHMTGSTKGGPYLNGPVQGGNRYGYVTVTDYGSTTDVHYNGYWDDNTPLLDDLTITLDTEEFNVPPGSEKGIYFDGTDDYIHLPDHVELNTGQSFPYRTMEGWIETGPDVTRLQCLYEEGGYNNGYSIYMENGNLYMVAKSANSGWSTPVSVSTPITANTIYRVAMVHDSDSGEIRGYLDGELFDTATGAGVMAAHIGFCALGRVTTNAPKADNTSIAQGSYFEGFMGFWRVFSRVRTQTEISEEMDAPATGLETDLTFAYNLNEEFGSVAADASLNAIHGTIYGDPVWGHIATETPGEPLQTEYLGMIPI